MKALEEKARALMREYSRRSNEALGDPDGVTIDALSDAFAGYFVGAGPAGVMGGARDESFSAAIREGFRTYRAAGGTRFEIVDLEAQALDDSNVMVRAGWEFDYVRPRDGRRGTIAFCNIYFINLAAGTPKIFAWITADETQAMKEHGLI